MPRLLLAAATFLVLAHSLAPTAAGVVVTPSAPAADLGGFHAIRMETPRCATRSCAIRVARRKCSQRRPVPCLKRAAIAHRVSFGTLLRKARCESRLNPYAYFGNPGNRAPLSPQALGDRSAGLTQFKPSTWRTTPYRRRSIWSAKWNALAAGWMHRVGRGGEWACR